MSKIFQLMKDNTKQMRDIGAELVRLLPDSIILGTGFLAVATLSFAHGAFFLALVESMLAFYGLRQLNNSLDLIRVYPNEKSLGKACRVGLTTQTTASLSLFTAAIRPSFPSAPIFIMAVASTYVILSMNAMSKELEMMGPDYVSRYWLSRLLLPILAFVVAAYRLFFSCDSVGSIIISAVFGVLVGTLLVYQNQALFGSSSLNLISVPRLRERTATGEKLYICPTQLKS